MLTLVKIEEIHRRKFLVTLDRDGKQMEYEFDVTLPEDARIGGASEPEKLHWDLFDYRVEGKPGFSRGALYVPAVYEVRRRVYDFAVGDEVDLPVVLDER